MAATVVVIVLMGRRLGTALPGLVAAVHALGPWGPVVYVLAYVVAAAMDVAHRATDKAEATRAQGFVDLMIPVVKGWSTEMGIEVASLGVQVHGGMGFIEETGAAQHYRDARILPIYEGTNGIQAIDLLTRKLPLEGGKVAEAYIAELAQTVADIKASNGIAHAINRVLIPVNL
mgnify:CR=1 FL=1